MMYNNSTHGVTSNMLRIIGGIETSKSKWPWHVALLNRYQVNILFTFILLQNAIMDENLKLL